MTVIPSADDTPKNVTQVVFTHTQIGESQSLTFLENLQYKLVGPYLCYRSYDKSKIWIVKVIQSDGKPLEGVTIIDKKR